MAHGQDLQSHRGNWGSETEARAEGFEREHASIRRKGWIVEKKKGEHLKKGPSVRTRTGTNRI